MELLSEMYTEEELFGRICETDSRMLYEKSGKKMRRPQKNGMWRDRSRVYANYKEMAEAESSRADGIDFVAITTPNDTHYDIARTFLEKESM